jgi:hypothetical protein
MIRLERVGSGPFDWGSVWQRSHLVLLLPHEGCEACDAAERALEGATGELASDRALALVARAGDARSGLPTLHDPEGALTRALEAPAGSVFAIDRFFEVLSRQDVHRDPAAAVRKAADRIDLAELACDECGVATW